MSLLWLIHQADCLSSSTFHLLLGDFHYIPSYLMLGIIILFLSISSALICVACDNVVSHNFPVGQREAKTAKTHINTVWHLNPVMIALPVLLTAIG